ncbi:phosphoribosyltransferase family protein [Chitinophagales bacterium]|nr:phosphoribosyltransferase family protein [Chitinophagales bacterium]
MSTERTIILSHSEIARKIERMAYEIYENNYLQEELVLIGIRERGTELANRLAIFLKSISSLQITSFTVNLNVGSPTEEELRLNRQPELLDGKTVILVDDVCNSGRTLCYAIKPLLEHLPKKIEIATLVNREHKSFPIRADYIGLSLATTLQEHIHVEFGKKDQAFLQS